MQDLLSVGMWAGVARCVSVGECTGVHSSGPACQSGVYVFEAGHVFVGMPAILVSLGPRSLQLEW